MKAKPELPVWGPVMDYRLPMPAIDLSRGYDHDPDAAPLKGAGGYLEHRRNMYTSELFEGRRYIHMGIDIWAAAGAPVYAPAAGTIHSFRDNNKKLDYGPTIVTKHEIGGRFIFALFGHLSRGSLEGLEPGMRIDAGMKLAELGSREENGGWIPHLHLQLSLTEPEEPDLPGVVAPEELEGAVKQFPDPRVFLGPLYF